MGKKSPFSSSQVFLGGEEVSRDEKEASFFPKIAIIMTCHHGEDSKLSCHFNEDSIISM